MRDPFIPAYILEHIDSSAAQDTLRHDRAFREERGRTPATPGAARGLERTIVDAQHQEQVTGKVVRREGEGPTGDPTADEAYDGLGATYKFWSEVFNRDSIDGKGLPLRGVVHYGSNYDNAFWDGTQMVFGDGDGETFTRFTADLDVIGHELGHGITEIENNLTYQGESGALNESFSDVYGSMVQQYADGQTTEQANWLIGDKLVLPGFPGKALRSMKAPGTAYDGDPQPDNYADLVTTTEDNGGVHINSGIPNRAFYELAARLGGYSWERAGAIWYATARSDQLKPDTNFQQFATLTHSVAQGMYGDTSEEASAVADAWEAVGLSV
jgi:Zn-dependent metalloprotease